MLPNIPAFAPHQVLLRKVFSMWKKPHHDSCKYHIPCQLLWQPPHCHRFHKALSFAPLTPANVLRKTSLRNIFAPTCMYFPNVHAHLLHYLHAITETEHNTLLCRTHDVRLTVFIEIQAVYRTSCFLVFKHTFRTIAKRNNRHAVTSR